MGGCSMPVEWNRPVLTVVSLVTGEMRPREVDVVIVNKQYKLHA